MYLSRVQLMSAIASQSQLGLLLRDNRYGVHRLLWDLFEEDKRNFLFRQEEGAKEQASAKLPLFYVLSKQLPKQASPLFKIDSKPFSPQLEAGDRLAFRLRANPVVAKTVPGQKNSRKHDVVMDAQRQFLHHACQQRSLSVTGSKSDLRKILLQHNDYAGLQGGKQLEQQLKEVVSQACVDWLEKRAEPNGFVLEQDMLQCTGYRWQALPEKKRQAGFSSLDYEGVLTVVDPILFLARLQKGFGPSKSFGCGLMLVRRLPD